MCGIVGYVGARPALGILIDGLRRLEYRGYDSAGVAVLADGQLRTERRAGKLANLEKALAESRDGVDVTRRDRHRNDRHRSHALGDPRWSDRPQRASAQLGRWPGRGHPQRHHRKLREAARRTRGRRRHVRQRHRHRMRRAPARRAELADGDAQGTSPTRCARSAADSTERSPCSPSTPRRPASWSARGATRPWSSGAAMARTSWPATCRRSSSTPATRSNSVRTRSSRSRRTASTSPTSTAIAAVGKDFHIDWDARAAAKDGHEFFMVKEIAEQPRAVADTLLGRLTETGEIMLDEVRLTDQDLRDVDKIFIVACGTAYHAGMVAKYAIEHWTRIPCEVELASEFRYRDPVLDRSTLVVAISQSGETMDTLMALRHAKDQKARVLAICNTNGSTIPRESDAVLYTRGGPEIAVASTKAFLTQLVACYLVGLHLAQVRGIKYADEVSAVVAELQADPGASSTPCSTSWNPYASWPGTWSTRVRCCSSAGTSASRSRWKARSSSRNSRTCTPRASPPASSSTGRSR